MVAGVLAAGVTVDLPKIPSVLAGEDGAKGFEGALGRPNDGAEGTAAGDANGFVGADTGCPKGVVVVGAVAWAKGLGWDGWNGCPNVVCWKLVGAVGWLNGLVGAAVVVAEAPKEGGLGCAFPNPEGWPNVEEDAVG